MFDLCVACAFDFMACFAPSRLCTPTRKHDVFVSFRGEDTRNNFTNHLYAALDRKGIITYRDDISLPKGEEIGPELVKAIETSKVAVIVFSKNYATSKWCLDELVKILKCKRRFNQKVLTIFYHVTPSDVRAHKGKFRKAFPNCKRKKVRRWEAALKEAANLAGLELKPHG